MGLCALPVLMMVENRRREWCGPVLLVLNDQPRECACPRPVGTRGGCGAGWGPGACPPRSSIRWGSVRQDGRTRTRTSTRPPHPLHPAPCPYRTRDAHVPIRLSNIIRTLGTQDGRPPTRTSTRPPHPPSLPDTFLEERKTDRGSSQYGGEERKKPHEIVRSSRTNKPMLGGRSQWMHRLYYGNSGTSKSRIFLARCTDIKRKHWPFL